LTTLYRRARAAGATYFFTINTYRRQRILTHADALRALREAIRTVKQRLPFHVDALVVLPDHLHAVLTLPTGDADFSSRRSLIKRQVAQSARRLVVEAQTASRPAAVNWGFGSAASGSIRSVMRRTTPGTLTTCITTP
jgi:putative transposase